MGEGGKGGGGHTLCDGGSACGGCSLRLAATVSSPIGTGDAGNTVTVFAECTSSLRIMANKVLEIVQ